MSPRAAWRLETLGFRQVYDYEAGKKDWGSWGLPREGSMVGLAAGDVARRDVPTSRLDERMPELRERVRDAGWDTAIVVNEQHIVLGRIGRRALAAEDDAPVAATMTPGPSTKRPSIGADALLELMREKDVTSWVITTPNGGLVGLARRADLEEALAESGQ